MNFLIIGSAEDPHVVSIGLELRTAGHDVLTWCTSEVPVQRVPIIRPETSQSLFQLPNQHFEPDVIWLRKRAKPALHIDYVGEERDFLEAECTAFIDGLLLTLEQACTMVNRASQLRQAASKALQLDLATKMGLRTPKTLITSDPISLQTFWRDVGGAVVFKPMSRSYVTIDPLPMVLPTTLLKAEHVLDDDLVRGSPGLYQEFVRKRGEVRVTMFGDEIIGAMVSGLPEDDVDWRSYFATDELAPCPLPRAISELCKGMLQFFQLEYATFDFAIDTNGEWVFFEMNEAGNFMFIHHRLPELQILERFSKFLIRRASTDSV